MLVVYSLIRMKNGHYSTQGPFFFEKITFSTYCYIQTYIYSQNVFIPRMYLFPECIYSQNGFCTKFGLRIIWSTGSGSM